MARRTTTPSQRAWVKSRTLNKTSWSGIGVDLPIDSLLLVREGRLLVLERLLRHIHLLALQIANLRQ
jgi:hypothetical protein